MELLTRQMCANNAAKNWKSQYYDSQSGIWKNCSFKSNRMVSSEIIYNKLVSLGETPNPNEVDKIIGNDSWTRITCIICYNCVDSAVFYYDGEYTSNFCKSCLKKALFLVGVEDE